MARISLALTETEKKQVAEYFSSIRFRSMMRVVESASAPQVRHTLNGLMLPLDDTHPMPLGQRIIEVPEFPELTEKMRYPRGSFIAYVPIGSVAKGEKLVTTGGEKTIPCNTCHGPLLQGLGDVPSIAGRTASYTMRQLWDVKQGTRKSPLMTPVVARLNAEDMLNIVAYLATRTP
jgi:cytochrome c553